jgi:hypothetical protein
VVKKFTQRKDAKHAKNPINKNNLTTLRSLRSLRLCGEFGVYGRYKPGNSGRLPGLRDDGLEFLLIVHRQTEFTEMRFCQRSHGKNQLIDAGIEQHRTV